MVEEFLFSFVLYFDVILFAHLTNSVRTCARGLISLWNLSRSDKTGIYFACIFRKSSTRFETHLSRWNVSIFYFLAHTHTHRQMVFLGWGDVSSQQLPVYLCELIKWWGEHTPCCHQFENLDAEWGQLCFACLPIPMKTVIIGRYFIGKLHSSS